MIVHIVMWKLKRSEDAPRFKALLETCSQLVPGIVQFEVGTTTTGLEASCDVVLVSRFTDEAALKAYAEHPTHQAVVKELGTLRESRHVVDYRVS